ncbi:MAG TPA: hypothetical protein VH740_24710 [Vicinamibacterales bacterium]
MPSSVELAQLLINCGNGAFEHRPMVRRRCALQIGRGSGSLQFERLLALTIGLLLWGEPRFRRAIARGFVLLRLDRFRFPSSCHVLPR